jgi:UTP--glucose-1-phosphate uridylyltransferase
MIKTVITAAGLGTRLLPLTKKLPKEILPIFYRTKNQIKPIPTIQVIFEQLYNCKIRNFCFVINNEKNIIKEHFNFQKISSPNNTVINKFNRQLDTSSITWVTQNTPKGFGDAVKRSEKYVGNDDFIVHGGDVSIFSKKIHPINRLIKTAKLNPNASIILLCKKVKDTSRYGVPKISLISKELFEVSEVVEKPSKPKSSYAIMPIYYFKPELFSYLKKITRGKNNEFQLTDAIQKTIENGNKVLSIPLKSYEMDLDVGTPESYKHALDTSYKWIHKNSL